MAHLYAIGAHVIYEAAYTPEPNKQQNFIVEAQMPPVGTSLQYRIKSEGESFRRVVSEHQISAMLPLV